MPREALSGRLPPLLLAIAATSAGFHAAAADSFVPDPDRAESMTLAGSTWVAAGDGFALRLRRLDEEERQTYLRHTTGSATDPFAAPPGSAPRFVTFLLELQNRDSPGLTLQAQSCWLVTNRQEHLLPLDLEQLGSSYGIVGAELPPAYRAAGRALLGSWTLGPGESSAGLLIYRDPQPRTRRYRVDMQLTRADGEVLRYAAAYRREKPAAER